MKIRTLLALLVLITSVAAPAQSAALLDAAQKLRDRSEIDGYNTMDQEYGNTNCLGEGMQSLPFAETEFRGGRTYFIFILVDDCEDCTVDLYWIAADDDPSDDVGSEITPLGCEMDYFEGGLGVGKQVNVQANDAYGQIGFCVHSDTPHYTRGLLFVKND